ncbi:MAG: radical SAM protein, partial [bacterium]|nr:radical SAM protein [bacterium]
MKYHIITFGCQMNESDSGRIAADLEKRGYKPAMVSVADLIVVNMCSVRQSAVDRIFGISQKLAELKAKKPKLKTILTGCILKTDRRKFRNKFDEIWEGEGDKSSSSPINLPAKRQNKSLAFIPISNGCNNSCSYCVVPSTRGPLVCRDHKEILKEVKSLDRKGLKEIWLLGQNVNDYQSPTDTSINFPKLLGRVSDIPGNFKIR